MLHPHSALENLWHLILLNSHGRALNFHDRLSKNNIILLKVLFRLASMKKKLFLDVSDDGFHYYHD